MPTLAQEIHQVSNHSFAAPEVRKSFLARVENGDLTRDEKAGSHFCVYFLPYNPDLKKVFVVHHKKAGLWISPGGHIDRGENLLGALQREIKEELGINYQVPSGIQPFLLTITHIDNPMHPCQTHFDIWYVIRTDGSNFQVDPREFYDTRWLTITEARGLVTDLPNLQALNRVDNGVV